MSLDNTATTTETHLNYESRLRELDEAVLLARQCLELHTPPDPLHTESLDNLAGALSTRFQDGGQQGDLHEAISLRRQALELRPPTDPLRPNSLNNLSEALLMRFWDEGQPSDLHEAILLPKQALELLFPVHPLQSLSIHNLSPALYRQFEIAGQTRLDLHESISLPRQPPELQPTSHSYQSLSLNNLALGLYTRFQQEGHRTDLDDSISLHRQALELRPLPHPLRASSLNDLAKGLWTRFEEGRHQSDLSESISLHRQALVLRPSPHPDRSKSLNNLAIALHIQFEEGGYQCDLNEAISLHRQALELRPSPHPLRSSSLVNLANVLFTRFEQEGHRSDLDDSILLHRQAVEILPLRHPYRSSFLDNLANALATRFQSQEGQGNDLDDSILLHRQALELLPSPHPLRSSSLNNLALGLYTRFEQEGRQSDLADSILLHRQALELQPSPNPYRSVYLNNLANGLRTRFEQEGRQTDLDEALSLHREALEFRVLPHPLRSQSLHNLANTLRTQFEHVGCQTGLHEAILLYRQALWLRPSPHPDQSRSLYELGLGLIHTLSHTSNKSDILDEAMELFCAATKCLNQAPSLRVHIAHTWIKHAVSHRHISAIDAHEAALQGLPKLAALSLDVKSRQKALLGKSDGLARDASRFAIRVGKTDKAIEFLEAGRAVFWSQFLSLRSPLEQLREISPELADKLQDAATALELGSHRTDASENQQKLVVDQETARLNRLNEEWSQAIDDVRKLNGFEDFLRPRSLSELQVAASDGPVVILTGNDDGSDILILTSVEVRTIHLSDLPNQELQTLVHFVRLASSDSLRSDVEDHFGNTAEFSPSMTEALRNWMKLKEERGMRYRGQKDSDTVFTFVLGTLWNKVVRPIIDILHFEKSEEQPVVQWCTTGLFSFLPIHAAGCYDDTEAIECASDYFISSYTPTIGALLTRYPIPTAPFRMMAVIQSRELPYTRKELEKIEQHVSNDRLVKLGVPGQSASVEAVASRLSDVAIAHFSCHGTQDRVNPLDSGLKLEDGHLRVSRIMKEKIQNGALAFLCACETAMGDDKLPDEAMSLGASLLFSGFRRVIATMWVMRDKDGPVIADAFYEELFRGPDGKSTQEPDVSKSAYALHMAVKKLRAENVSFGRWVPFIHMGK